MKSENKVFVENLTKYATSRNGNFSITTTTSGGKTRVVDSVVDSDGSCMVSIGKDKKNFPTIVKACKWISAELYRRKWKSVIPEEDGATNHSAVTETEGATADDVNDSNEIAQTETDNKGDDEKVPCPESQPLNDCEPTGEPNKGADEKVPCPESQPLNDCEPTGEPNKGADEKVPCPESQPLNDREPTGEPNKGADEKVPCPESQPLNDCEPTGEPNKE